MPSLTAKVIHGKTYDYARECKRVGGKPKIVRTIYLGSLDNILKAATQAATQAATGPGSYGATGILPGTTFRLINAVLQH